MTNNKSYNTKYAEVYYYTLDNSTGKTYKDKKVFVGVIIEVNDVWIKVISNKTYELLALIPAADLAGIFCANQAKDIVNSKNPDIYYIDCGSLPGGLAKDYIHRVREFIEEMHSEEHSEDKHSNVLKKIKDLMKVSD